MASLPSNVGGTCVAATEDALVCMVHDGETIQSQNSAINVTKKKPINVADNPACSAIASKIEKTMKPPVYVP